MIKGERMQKGFRKLKAGMTRAEVIEILGNPDSEGLRNGVEMIGWTNQEWKGILFGGRITRSIEVELVDGKVVGFTGQNINMSAW